MGLRSPQQLLQPGIRQARSTAPVGGTRFAPGEAPRISTEFIQTLAADAQKREQDKMKFTLAKAQNEAQRALYEYKAKAATLAGSDALAKVPQIRDELAKKLDTTLSAYPPELKQQLDLIADEAVTGYDSFGFAHQYNEGEKLRKEVFSERLSQTMNDTIEFSQDEGVFAQNLSKVEKNAVELARQKYGENPVMIDPETGETIGDLASSAANEAVSKTLLGTVSQMTSVGKLNNAEILMGKYNERFTPGDRERALKMLAKAKEQGETDVARALMDQASQFSENPTKQEKFLRYNSPSDKVYAQALRFNSVRLKMEADAEKRASEASVAKMFNSVNAQKPINMDELRMMKPADQARVLSYAEKIYNNDGIPMPGNSKLFNDLVMRGTSSPNGFQDVNVDAYADQLSPKQRQTLASMKVRDAQSRATREGKVLDMGYDRALKIGLLFGQGKGFASGDQEMADIQARAVEIYEEERAMNPTRPLQDIDMTVRRRLLDEAKPQTVTQDRFGASVVRFLVPGISEFLPLTKEVEIEPEIAPRNEPGVNAQDMRMINDFLRRKGIPQTPANQKAALEHYRRKQPTTP
jgi:DNA-binding protein YbaB